MKTIIIDPGHGGLWDDVYCTAGKRSPQIPPGFFEGQQVRKIANALMEIDQDRYKWISPIMDLPEDQQPDVSLKCRRLVYNGLPADLLLSLHTNAKGKNGKWQTARGTKLFFRKVKPIQARAFLNSYCETADLPNRGTARNLTFTILKSIHPSILIEMGFHTNLMDVQLLKWPENIARALLAGLDAYFKI